MNKHQYERYKKGHNYKHAMDVEKGKIYNEKMTYGELQNKIKIQYRNMLNNCDIASLEDLELTTNEVDDNKAKKIIRNSRTHKKRYKSLKKYEE